MVDIEGLRSELDNYLSGGQYPVGACVISSPEPQGEEEPEVNDS